MSDINELQLNHPSIGDANDAGVGGAGFVEGSDRSKWAVLIALLLVAAGVLGYVAWKRRSVAPQVAATPAATAPAPAVAAPRAGPLVEAEKIALPPLSETDAIVRELVVKLSSHPKALAWLATDGLIENFTVATLNLSEGTTPVAHWPALKPRARFSVVETPRGTALDPKSYRRYDEYAAAIGALDPAGTARLYLTLKPRIADAYRQLGYPDGDFDPVLERAFGVLLATPVVEGEIPLHQKVLSYQFIDPKIESLPASAKQLLRMGPANMKIVQDKLREIARQLGLHPAG
jgi:hypothetical protein